MFHFNALGYCETYRKPSIERTQRGGSFKVYDYNITDMPELRHGPSLLHPAASRMSCLLRRPVPCRARVLLSKRTTAFTGLVENDPTSSSVSACISTNTVGTVLNCAVKSATLAEQPRHHHAMALSDATIRSSVCLNRGRIAHANASGYLLFTKRQKSHSRKVSEHTPMPPLTILFQVCSSLLAPEGRRRDR
jgi:hypothetical protein